MRWPGFIRSLCASCFGFDPADPPETRAHDRAMRRFINDGVRRRATHDELNRELRLRTAMATIRREASDWTEREPHAAARAVSFTTTKVAGTLPREEAKILSEAVGRLSMADMLYPEASRAAARASKLEAALMRRVPSVDEIAALRSK